MRTGGTPISGNRDTSDGFCLWSALIPSIWKTAPFYGLYVDIPDEIIISYGVLTETPFI